MKQQVTLYLFLLFLAASQFSFAQQFHLVRDIDTSTSSNPQINSYMPYGNFLPAATLNGFTYFAANDGSHGRELWRSDGTSAGTTLCADIYPGEQSSNPQQIVICNNKLFFITKDSFDVTEIWLSDGSVTGTKRVFRIAYINNIVATDTVVYFNTFNKIYKTNGTPEGTSIVKDFTQDNGVFLGWLSVAHGRLFFQAFTDDNNHNGSYMRLWMSDGTTAGTAIVGDNIVDPGFPVQGNDDYFYFTGHTPADPTTKLLFGRISQPSQALQLPGTEYLRVQSGTTPVFHNNSLFFISEIQNKIKALYRYNFNESLPTRFLKEVTPGNDMSYALNLIVSGNLVYLTTRLYNESDSTSGYEIWSSDDALNTVRLLSATNAANNINIPTLFDVNGTVYFAGYDSLHGIEPWKSDGTVSGTVMLKDIVPGSANSNRWSYGFGSAGNKVLFAAFSSVGNELWASDGGTGGTQLLKDINQTTSTGSMPAYAIGRKDKIIFTAPQSDDGIYKLWISNGTTQGTKPVEGFISFAFPSQYISYGNGDSIYCFGQTGLAGKYGIYGVNVKSWNRWLIKEMPTNDTYVYWAVAGNKFLYFLTYRKDATIWTWWRSDFTSNGTVPVATGGGIFAIQTGASGRPPLVINNTLYYISNETGKAGLWRVEDSANNIVNLTGSNLFNSDAQPQYLTNYKGKLYFTAYNSEGNVRIWRTDGTQNVTTPLAGDYQNPQSLFVAGGRLFFSASSSTDGTELWSTDGATTALLKDINPGTASSGPQTFTRVGGKLFFYADDGEHGFELWKTDGTSAGTMLVKDITPGPNIGYPPYTGDEQTIVNVSGKLCFVVNRNELWTSDGTDTGTQRINDPALAGLSLIQSLVAVENKLWLTGTTYKYGEEPYIGTVAPAPLPLYTFTGNGSFDNPANWLEGKVPPEDIYNGTEVIIKPASNAACIFNQPLHIRGGKLTIAAGAKIILPAELSAF